MTKGELIAALATVDDDREVVLFWDGDVRDTPAFVCEIDRLDERWVVLGRGGWIGESPGVRWIVREPPESPFAA